MSTIAQKVGNVCVWCAVAAIAVMTVATAGTLIWIGIM